MQKQEINKALSLHVQDSLHQRNIMIQRRRNEKLDAEIAAIEEDIKREMGLKKRSESQDHETVFETPIPKKKEIEKEKATERKANVLELRLRHAQKRLAMLDHDNLTLKSRIDELRRNRLMFERAQTRHKEEMTKIQEQITLEMANAEELCSERDQLLSQIDGLLAERTEEEKEFQEHMEHYDITIQKTQESSKSFMDQLGGVGGGMGASRTDMGADESEMPSALGSHGRLALKHQLQQQVEEAIEAVKEEQHKVRETKERVSHLDEAFQKLKDAVGQHDIDQMVINFLAVEDDLFNMLKYIQNVNDETTAEEETRERIKNEMEKMKNAEGEIHRQKQKQLRELEEKQAAVERDIQEAKFQQEACAKEISMWSRSLNKMLQLLQVDTSQSVQTLISFKDDDTPSPQAQGLNRKSSGGSLPTMDASQGKMPRQDAGPNPTNLVPLFGAIEEKAIELINQYSRVGMTPHFSASIESSMPPKEPLANVPQISRKVESILNNFTDEDLMEEFSTETGDDDNPRIFSVEDCRNKVKNSHYASMLADGAITDYRNRKQRNSKRVLP